MNNVPKNSLFFFTRCYLQANCKSEVFTAWSKPFAFSLKTVGFKVAGTALGFRVPAYGFAVSAVGFGLKTVGFKVAGTALGFDQPLKTQKTLNLQHFLYKSNMRPYKISKINLQTMSMQKPEQVFFNRCFDKGRLKTLITWSVSYWGEKKTVDLVESLKTLGYGYATKAGISLSVDDLLIPNIKNKLLVNAESKLEYTNQDVSRGYLTSIEYLAQVIDTWNNTSEIIKNSVIENFKTKDVLNPVYMMAFSGARGNISQVRQLVGMRGLMADPTGKIIDFPIQSNFREGLTLTEYVISCYGARKGVVDTALRTATSGYLTRRLVDVAQHVIIRVYDCSTKRGIYLADLKTSSKNLLTLKNRLIGRVLAENVYIQNSELLKPKNSLKSNLNLQKKTTYLTPHNLIKNTNTTQKQKNTQTKFKNVSQRIASRNQIITTDLAQKLILTNKSVLVRSPLTCQDKNYVCQLCYGWSLSHKRLVPLGETVGIIAAQSIGEPGTQLTMRTFHTGGVFSGIVSDQIKAPFSGQVSFNSSIPGKLIRTTHGQIAFLTKQDSFLVLTEYGVHTKTHKKNSKVINLPQASLRSNKFENNNKKSNYKSIQIKIPSYSLLFVKQSQKVTTQEILAESPEFLEKNSLMTQSVEAFQTVYSEMSGIVKFRKNKTIQKINDSTQIYNPKSSSQIGEFWVLSAQKQPILKPVNLFVKAGDFCDLESFIYNYKLLSECNKTSNTTQHCRQGIKNENVSRWVKSFAFNLAGTAEGFKAPAYGFAVPARNFEVQPLNYVVNSKVTRLFKLDKDLTWIKLKNSIATSTDRKFQTDSKKLKDLNFALEPLKQLNCIKFSKIKFKNYNYFKSDFSIIKKNKYKFLNISPENVDLNWKKTQDLIDFKNKNKVSAFNKYDYKKNLIISPLINKQQNQKFKLTNKKTVFLNAFKKQKAGFGFKQTFDLNVNLNFKCLLFEQKTNLNDQKLTHYFLKSKLQNKKFYYSFLNTNIKSLLKTNTVKKSSQLNYLKILQEFYFYHLKYKKCTKKIFKLKSFFSQTLLSAFYTNFILTNKQLIKLSTPISMSFVPDKLVLSTKFNKLNSINVIKIFKHNFLNLRLKSQKKSNHTYRFYFSFLLDNKSFNSKNLIFQTEKAELSQMLEQPLILTSLLKQQQFICFDFNLKQIAQFHSPVNYFLLSELLAFYKKRLYLNASYNPTLLEKEKLLISQEKILVLNFYLSSILTSKNLTNKNLITKEVFLNNRLLIDNTFCGQSFYFNKNVASLTKTLNLFSKTHTNKSVQFEFNNSNLVNVQSNFVLKRNRLIMFSTEQKILYSLVNDIDYTNLTSNNFNENPNFVYNKKANNWSKTHGWTFIKKLPFLSHPTVSSCLKIKNYLLQNISDPAILNKGKTQINQSEHVFKLWGQFHMWAYNSKHNKLNFIKKSKKTNSMTVEVEKLNNLNNLTLLNMSTNKTNNYLNLTSTNQKQNALFKTLNKTKGRNKNKNIYLEKSALRNIISNFIFSKYEQQLKKIWTKTLVNKNLLNKNLFFPQLKNIQVDLNLKFVFKNSLLFDLLKTNRLFVLVIEKLLYIEKNICLKNSLNSRLCFGNKVNFKYTQFKGKNSYKNKIFIENYPLLTLQDTCLFKISDIFFFFQTKPQLNANYSKSFVPINEKDTNLKLITRKIWSENQTFNRETYDFGVPNENFQGSCYEKLKPVSKTVLYNSLNYFNIQFKNSSLKLVPALSKILFLKSQQTSFENSFSNVYYVLISKQLKGFKIFDIWQSNNFKQLNKNSKLISDPLNLKKLKTNNSLNLNKHYVISYYNSYSTIQTSKIKVFQINTNGLTNIKSSDNKKSLTKHYTSWLGGGLATNLKNKELNFFKNRVYFQIYKNLKLSLKTLSTKKTELLTDIKNDVCNDKLNQNFKLTQHIIKNWNNLLGQVKFLKKFNSNLNIKHTTVQTLNLSNQINSNKVTELDLFAFDFNLNSKKLTHKFFQTDFFNFQIKNFLSFNFYIELLGCSIIEPVCINFLKTEVQPSNLLLQTIAIIRYQNKTKNNFKTHLLNYSNDPSNGKLINGKLINGQFLKIIEKNKPFLFDETLKNWSILKKVPQIENPSTTNQKNVQFKNLLQLLDSYLITQQIGWVSIISNPINYFFSSNKISSLGNLINNHIFFENFIIVKRCFPFKFKRINIQQNSSLWNLNIKKGVFLNNTNKPKNKIYNSIDSPFIPYSSKFFIKVIEEVFFENYLQSTKTTNFIHKNTNLLCFKPKTFKKSYVLGKSYNLKYNEITNKFNFFKKESSKNLIFDIKINTHLKNFLNFYFTKTFIELLPEKDLIQKHILVNMNLQVLNIYCRFMGLKTIYVPIINQQKNFNNKKVKIQRNLVLKFKKLIFNNDSRYKPKLLINTASLSYDNENKKSILIKVLKISSFSQPVFLVVQKGTQYTIPPTYFSKNKLSLKNIDIENIGFFDFNDQQKNISRTNQLYFNTRQTNSIAKQSFLNFETKILPCATWSLYESTSIKLNNYSNIETKICPKFQFSTNLQQEEKSQLKNTDFLNQNLSRANSETFSRQAKDGVFSRWVPAKSFAVLGSENFIKTSKLEFLANFYWTQCLEKNKLFFVLNEETVQNLYNQKFKIELKSLMENFGQITQTIDPLKNIMFTLNLVNLFKYKTVQINNVSTTTSNYLIQIQIQNYLFSNVNSNVICNTLFKYKAQPTIFKKQFATQKISKMPLFKIGNSFLKGELLFTHKAKTSIIEFNKNIETRLKYGKKHPTQLYYLTDKDLVTCQLKVPNKQRLKSNPNLNKVLSQSLKIQLGQFVAYGTELFSGVATSQSGQILLIDKSKICLRRAKTFLLSSGGICNLNHNDFVNIHSPLLTLTYKNLKNEDIVQGIPKIEQIFEARENLTQQSSLNNIVKVKCQSYKKIYPKPEAVRKTIEFIQQYIVDAIQDVYQSQGVNISDKHVEIIVKQMTSKVRITEVGSTGLLRGDIVYLDWIELVNSGLEGRKAQYEPMVMGISRASLEMDGFISAASFQETIKILSRAAILQKRDFLRGLKENLILGHLLPAGTGFEFPV